MRKRLPEKYRFPMTGTMYESAEGNDFGLFRIPNGEKGFLACMVGPGSDEIPFEHISVVKHYMSGKKKKKATPSWDEMCKVKRHFFKEDEVVMQLHPAERNYISIHDNCLHLWRPTKQEIPLPPLIAI